MASACRQDGGLPFQRAVAGVAERFQKLTAGRVVADGERIAVLRRLVVAGRL